MCVSVCVCVGVCVHACVCVASDISNELWANCYNAWSTGLLCSRLDYHETQHDCDLILMNSQQKQIHLKFPVEVNPGSSDLHSRVTYKHFVLKPNLPLEQF